MANMKMECEDGVFAMRCRRKMVPSLESKVKCAGTEAFIAAATGRLAGRASLQTLPSAITHPPESGGQRSAREGDDDVTSCEAVSNNTIHVLCSKVSRDLPTFVPCWAWWTFMQEYSHIVHYSKYTNTAHLARFHVSLIPASLRTVLSGARYNDLCRSLSFPKRLR